MIVTPGEVLPTGVPSVEGITLTPLETTVIALSEVKVWLASFKVVVPRLSVVTAWATMKLVKRAPMTPKRRARLEGRCPEPHS